MQSAQFVLLDFVSLRGTHYLEPQVTVNYGMSMQSRQGLMGVLRVTAFQNSRLCISLHPDKMPQIRELCALRRAHQTNDGVLQGAAITESLVLSSKA